MSDTIWHDRIRDLLDQVGTIAEQVEVRAAHWLCTPQGDDGLNWCRSCARAVLRHRRRQEKDRSKRSGYLLDGGWRTDHDTPPACDGCRVTLDGSLTVYGAQQEMDYFIECGVRPGSGYDALALYEIMLALECSTAENAPLADMAADFSEALLWSAV